MSSLVTHTIACSSLASMLPSFMRYVTLRCVIRPDKVDEVKFR